MNEYYTPPRTPEIPNLSDEEVAAITVFRDTIGAQVKAMRETEQGKGSFISTVAIDSNKRLVHVIENPSSITEFFTVRVCHIDDLIAGVPVTPEVLEYGTDQAVRFRGSGTVLLLDDGTKVFNPGKHSEERNSMLNGEPLFRLGNDDRPLPLE